MAPLRSRSAQFCQTWHTCPCQSTLSGLSPFQVCTLLTDLERSPLIELLLWHVPVPGLHGFDRPGTPAPVRALSMVLLRSRSAQFCQTWHTCPCQSALCGSSPCQRPLRGIPPFQVCTFLGRPGAPAPVRALSMAPHRSRSAPF